MSTINLKKLQLFAANLLFGCKIIMIVACWNAEKRFEKLFLSGFSKTEFRKNLHNTRFDGFLTQNYWFCVKVEMVQGRVNIQLSEIISLVRFLKKISSLLKSIAFI